MTQRIVISCIMIMIMIIIMAILLDDSPSFWNHTYHYHSYQQISQLRFLEFWLAEYALLCIDSNTLLISPIAFVSIRSTAGSLVRFVQHRLGGVCRNHALRWQHPHCAPECHRSCATQSTMMMMIIKVDFCFRDWTVRFRDKNVFQK
jgi:hypothetical protein